MCIRDRYKLSKFSKMFSLNLDISVRSPLPCCALYCARMRLEHSYICLLYTSEISLGLDLKGGMNVILAVSVPDVIKALADNKPDEAFNNALATAAKQAINSQDDVRCV